MLCCAFGGLSEHICYSMNNPNAKIYTFMYIRNYGYLYKRKNVKKIIAFLIQQ